MIDVVMTGVQLITDGSDKWVICNVVIRGLSRVEWPDIYYKILEILKMVY